MFEISYVGDTIRIGFELLSHAREKRTDVFFLLSPIGERSRKWFFIQSLYGERCINVFFYSLHTEKVRKMIFYTFSIQRKVIKCISMHSPYRESMKNVFFLFSPVGERIF